MNEIKVTVLLLGTEQYDPQVKTADGVALLRDPELTSFNEKGAKAPDAAILARTITPAEEKLLSNLLRPYCLFILNTVKRDHALRGLMQSKKAELLSREQLDLLLEREISDYFSYQYGEKFIPSSLGIAHGFQGSVRWNGFTEMILEGNFGEDLTQAVFWRSNLPVQPGLGLDFWLEYKKTPGIEIMLEISEFEIGSPEGPCKSWRFNEQQMENIVTIDETEREGNLFCSVLAKGKGTLKIIALHDRHSRHGHGAFLPGGKRLVTADREEAFFYFDPMDRKPPLNVYFSGYKTREGFEGQNMMRKMGAPFLLVAESRLEGGAFYLGSEEYEHMIVNEIHSVLRELGFSSEQVIFSGLSMGTFGAMYYAAYLRPYAVILGKPLASLGNMANYERIERPGGFPTSLDVLYKQNRSLDKPSEEKLNGRFWNLFDQTDWSRTKFIISHMLEDDYDGTAYKTMISHLTGTDACVYGHGFHGRHNDNTGGIVEWFVRQYLNILTEDFYRNRF